MPLPRRSAALVGATALLLVAACGSGASADEVATANTSAAPVETADAGSAAATAPVSVESSAAADASAGRGAAASCPATLVANAVPAGARMIGAAPAAPIALSSATVTADAVAAIGSDLSGMAEVEPEDGPARAGVETQLYQVEPSADAPHTLVCRYGTPTPPLMAQAALLLPIAPRAGGYRCTVELPQGRDTRRVTARCSAT